MFGASARTAVIFQSTLPGWGATSKFCMSVWFCEISIHAPRMGSDRCGRLRTLREPRISIHAPRMGSDHLTGVSGRTTADFNPRSPDGERPERGVTGVAHGDISIHAPRMGSDGIVAEVGDGETISIHAPRMGSDRSRRTRRSRTRYFNPRSPDGERPPRPTGRCRCHHFNPRSPDGERRNRPRSGHRTGYFNPRSPDGERPRKWTSSPTIWAKSSIFNTDCIADRR